MRAVVLLLLMSLLACRRAPEVEARPVAAETVVFDPTIDAARVVEFPPRELPVSAVAIAGDTLHVFGAGTLYSISESDGRWRERTIPDREIDALTSDGTTLYGFDRDKRELVAIGDDVTVLAHILGREPRDSPLVFDPARDRIILSDKACGDDTHEDCYRVLAVPRTGGPREVLAEGEGSIFWMGVVDDDVYWQSQPIARGESLIRKLSAATGKVTTVRSGAPTIGPAAATAQGVAWLDNDGAAAPERLLLLRRGDTAGAMITHVPSRELGNQHLAGDGEFLYMSNHEQLERYDFATGAWKHLGKSPHHIDRLLVGRSRLWWITWDFRRATREVHSIEK